jgi:methionyl-tRNA synthetase
MNNVIEAVSEGLEDLSISRPVERLSWGIPVPSDPSQTIYVWLDALVNYITKAGYPWTPGQEQEGGWPADLQVVGKDIVRFHCIYWPAFLLALDIAPPKQILTHAHWTLGRQKMAKSTGNGVNPFFAIDRFGIDTLRYYLAHDGGIREDADYANEFIIQRYKKDLQETLGNLTSRIVRGKGWSVRNAVTKGVSHSKTDGVLDEGMNRSQRELIKSLPKSVESKMHELDPGAALKMITGVLVQV